MAYWTTSIISAWSYALGGVMVRVDRLFGLLVIVLGLLSSAMIVMAMI
jgi:hypothetical protein